MLDVDVRSPVSVFVSDTRQRVSLATGWESTDVTWQVDEECRAWQFREVANVGDGVTLGTLLVAGGAIAPDTQIITTIAASLLSGGDGSKIIKIFAQDSSGNWTT